MSDFKLILVDPAPLLCAEWRAHFADMPDVEVVQGYFENIATFDCMVSPANSFGLMDGGVDAAITHFFGEALMHRVQERILTEYGGEQPVGTSMIVETGHRKHPFLAHSPTMRFPMPIATTDNVYTAMWAMLLAVRRHNRTSERPIATVVCPGLGTGIGQMPPDEAARQMALAYRHLLHPPKTLNWPVATARQKSIGRGGDLALAVIRRRSGN